MLESCSDTSREGVNKFFLASVDTSRESGGEEVERRSNTSGEVGSRFPSTLFSSVRGESKYSLVAERQRDIRIELAKTTVGSSVSEETSQSHAHDDVTHAMTMTRTGMQAVGRGEGCGRVQNYYSKDSRDSVTMAPRLRTEKKAQLLHAV